MPNSTLDPIDLLKYTYDGNKFIAVDNGVCPGIGGDFLDNGHYYSVSHTAEYAYDANGNLTRDDNKEIINITYNYLNLPVSIDKTGGNRIVYIYDAAGNKLRQEYSLNGTITKTTDFVGNFVYENNIPAWVINNEGRVILNSIGTAYCKEVYLKDHLGNIRVACRLESGVLRTRQVDRYYPFGMNIKGLTANSSTGIRPNEYLYNGKMMQDEHGLNWLDYGARFYDPVLGRWHSVDPLADERSWVSPYSYCQNNPLNRIDPTGALDWIPPSDGSGNWTTEAGDSPGSLARDANITQAEAESAVRTANQNRGQARSSDIMVYEGDKVNVANRPGYTWSSGSSTTNSSTPATPSTPSTAASTSGSSGNTMQTINTVATTGGLITDATREVVQIPSVGYNIAYNSTLLKSVNYLKPISYGLSGITVASDFYLSANGQQSWGETGLNTTVTGISMAVGGWPGLIIQANYQASKLYMKTLKEHPDWAPYPSNGFRH